MVTDLCHDFHGEAFGDCNHCCLKQAQVSDGPTARGKLHLRIRIIMVWCWVWFGWFNYTSTHKVYAGKFCNFRC